MKEKTITLKEATIIILRSIIEYNKEQFEHAERVDQFKDNGYLINACKDFLEAIK